MSKAELFDVLKEQLFDRLVTFDAQKKEIFSSVKGVKIEEICKDWPKFAKVCAMSLNQIATASRLERYEYQETLEENIKSLRSNPKAFEVVSKSRDQSILLEFFARVLSLLYYETILEGVFKTTRDSSIIDDYAQQMHELSEIILFSLGKELIVDEKSAKEKNSFVAAGRAGAVGDGGGGGSRHLAGAGYGRRMELRPSDGKGDEERSHCRSTGTYLQQFSGDAVRH